MLSPFQVYGPSHLALCSVLHNAKRIGRVIPVLVVFPPSRSVLGTGRCWTTASHAMGAKVPILGCNLKGNVRRGCAQRRFGLHWLARSVSSSVFAYSPRMSCGDHATSTITPYISYPTMYEVTVLSGVLRWKRKRIVALQIHTRSQRTCPKRR